ncbi:IclR family transcriptional regulator [Rhodococcus opacus]|uniref:IclR family transcriptional regulator n=1 Tax=Rhodococcus opacus TaxID=37919 RepID=UPI001C47E83F|nr:IclR family transcriptional regulator [Rhodococcus opacus]MBV6760410.1 IclR family transcriptional regulator [Rhodococcus opacus]
MAVNVDSARDDRAAIDKAISLLVSFGDQASTGVGVSELARRAKLNKSTAHRVLAGLERNGVVERIGTRYRLGARLHDLGRSVYAPGHEQLRDLLIPFLTDLYVGTGETVHLAALHGTDVVYLAKLYGHRQVHSPSRIGGRIPAHCTAVGKVLLAYDHAGATQTLAGPLRRYTPRTLTDPGDLAAALETIRRDGIAFENDEVQPGLSCVAVPIIGPSGRPVAAFSVSGSTHRIDLRGHSSMLRRICSAASRALLLDRTRVEVASTAARAQRALAS